MKRYGNLFERVVEYGNLEQAFHNAARHKTRRSEVIEYGSHLEANLLQLQRELITGTYRTSEYKTFIIYEPKERKIFKLPFRDRVVHWAIMQVIERYGSLISPMIHSLAYVGVVFTLFYTSSAVI